MVGVGEAVRVQRHVRWRWLVVEGKGEGVFVVGEVVEIGGDWDDALSGFFSLVIHIEHICRVSPTTPARAYDNHVLSGRDKGGCFGLLWRCFDPRCTATWPSPIGPSLLTVPEPHLPSVSAFSAASCGRRWTSQTSIRGRGRTLKLDPLAQRTSPTSTVGTEDKYSIRSASPPCPALPPRPFLFFTITPLHSHRPARGQPVTSTPFCYGLTRPRPNRVVWLGVEQGLCKTLSSWVEEATWVDYKEEDAILRRIVTQI